MITVSKINTISLKEELKTALLKYSYGKLDGNKAEKIADKAIDNFDFTNSALSHKGMNWYAKELLGFMGIKRAM